jgi:glyoxalase family protein
MTTGNITGLHHITGVIRDAQRSVDFYTQVLGLRLIKQTVNFDDPGAYHIYFGNDQATTGSAITFFEWKHTPQGHPGVGGTHHVALTVADYDGLLKWKRRLTDLDISVDGPFDRHYFTSIYFKDPDGLIIEIATREPGMAVDEELDKIGTAFLSPPKEMMIRNRDEETIRATTWAEPVPTVTPDMRLDDGMHHITAIGSDIHRTDAFFSELLGLRKVKMTSNFDDPDSAHWYWGNENGAPGTLITYFERKPGAKKHIHYKPVQMGAGQTHHYALSVPDADTQLMYREKLIKAGFRVSPVMERVYFQSIYTNDPDGHIVEIATAGPGFMVDEDYGSLGSTLKLPPWLEQHRNIIEARLKPINVPMWEGVPA